MKVITKQQSEFLVRSAKISPVNNEVYTIFISDNDDLAYELNIFDICEKYCIKWWNEKYGVKFVLPKDFIKYRKQELQPEQNIFTDENCAYLYTGLGSGGIK